MKLKKLTTRELTTLGLLIALNAVFSEFLDFQITESLKISTSFIILAITGAAYGPLYAGIAAGVGDLLGIFIFPSPYAAFFGFTLSAMVDGAIYGLLLSKKPYKKINVVITVILSTIVITYLLNTFWLTITMSTGFFVLLGPRVIKSLFEIPFKIAVLFIIMPIYHNHIEKFVKD